MLTSVRKLIRSWKSDEDAKSFYKAELKQFAGYFVLWLVIYIVFLILV